MLRIRTQNAPREKEGIEYPCNRAKSCPSAFAPHPALTQSPPESS